MSINGILSYAVFSRLSSSNDDGWTDRLNHLYTVFILVIFTIIVGSKQFVGDAIQCLVPPEYKPTYNAYVLAHCWMNNTYYVDMEEEIPKEIEKRGAKELAYYQWVPIILLFMAFLFKIPYVLWRIMSNATGFNVSTYVTLAVNSQYGPCEKHDERMKQMAEHLDKWLEFYKKVLTLPPRCDPEKQRYIAWDGGKRWYIIIIYFIAKILYSVNVVCQFFMLDEFLGGWFSLYGSSLIKKLLTNRAWGISTRFPLQTLCELVIRNMNNVLRFTIQCVLPINLFNEKIFLFLWFWLVFVSVMSILSLLRWFRLMTVVSKRISFVEDYLRLLNALCGEQDKSHVKKFVTDYLQGDGVFILKMLENNCGPVVTSDIVRHLWYLYRIRPMPSSAEYATQTQF
ncbi:hypothetical protein SNE40_011592 [Patella caerulea]|uniref:Innexin n=1 Tax=Patella caerulea TaxID=87958 RepID=A0AAN8PIV6_PATCE